MWWQWKNMTELKPYAIERKSVLGNLTNSYLGNVFFAAKSISTSVTCKIIFLYLFLVQRRDFHLITWIRPIGQNNLCINKEPFTSTKIILVWRCESGWQSSKQSGLNPWPSLWYFWKVYFVEFIKLDEECEKNSIFGDKSQQLDSYDLFMNFKLQIQFHVKYIVTSYLKVCLDEVSCEASCPCLKGEGSVRVARHPHGVFRCQLRYRRVRTHVPRRPVPELSITQQSVVLHDVHRSPHWSGGPRKQC